MIARFVFSRICVCFIRISFSDIPAETVGSIFK